MIRVCSQNELPESNIVFYEDNNPDEFAKKIGFLLTSIVESVDKEKVSTGYRCIRQYCTYISYHKTNTNIYIVRIYCAICQANRHRCVCLCRRNKSLPMAWTRCYWMSYGYNHVLDKT